MLPVSLSLSMCVYTTATSFSDSFLFLATFYRRVEKERESRWTIQHLILLLFVHHQIYISFFFTSCVYPERRSCVCVCGLFSLSFCTIFFFSFLGRWQLFVCRFWPIAVDLFYMRHLISLPHLSLFLFCTLLCGRVRLIYTYIYLLRAFLYTGVELTAGGRKKKKEKEKKTFTSFVSAIYFFISTVKIK